MIYIRILVFVVIYLSFLVWLHLNKYHQIDHRTLPHAAFRHDPENSYTYVRGLPLPSSIPRPKSPTGIFFRGCRGRQSRRCLVHSRHPVLDRIVSDLRSPPAPPLARGRYSSPCLRPGTSTSTHSTRSITTPVRASKAGHCSRSEISRTSEL
jgi:hypothetical protein